MARSLTVAFALTAPIALWNLRGFWRDIVLVHIRGPFRPGAGTIGNLRFPIPRADTVLPVFISVVFSSPKARPHRSMFAACYGFTLLVFVCTNKQAFCNYYFLIVHTLLLAIAARDIPNDAETRVTEALLALQHRSTRARPRVLT